jgi:Asp-tRNA(Asn)/Glu-tRNA(Gln) amidotransferase A subunit family amidase
MTTLRELADGVRSRRVGSHELVSESIRRIESLDPDLGAVVALRAEEALAEARALDDLVAGGDEVGPLTGLPFLVKDMTDVEGMRTTFGSRVFAAAPAATTDAMVVARLRAAGAIVVGKTNLPEFAAEGYTSNLLFGTTRNPWNAGRTCGGSSGGSAVAIAAGMAAIATATDGGGSIRIPAAYCGLVGLKPTNGVIGRDPIPDWIDLSTDGPFSTHAEDLRLLLDVFRGPAPGDPTAQEGRPPDRDDRIGTVFVIERWTDYGPLPPETAGVFRAAAARFADVFDTELTPITPSDLFGDDKIDDDWFTLCCAEHAHRFGRAWYDAHVDELHRSAQSFLGFGFKITLEEYLEARRRRFAYVRALDELLGATNGVVLSPVMTVDAFPAEGPGDGEGTGPEPYATAAQNITGHPALSLPAGSYPSGVPFGLQVTGPRFRDDLLADLAMRWQEASPWPLTAPGFAPFGE